MSNRIEVLESLDLNELEALADSKLAPSSQQRLDELLARNSESDLNDEDAKELDQLLGMVDQLNILKTRARYTLRQHAVAARR